MDDDWALLGECRFTPAVVEQLIGVSTSLLRKWVQLHLNGVQEPGEWWTVSAGNHRRFTWSGVQFLLFFRDVTADLGARWGKGGFAEQPGKGDWADTALIHSNVFRTDHRAREQGDLFISRSLMPNGPDWFFSASFTGLQRLLHADEGQRLYTYNLSAMQRDLAKRAIGHRAVDQGTLECQSAAARS